MKTFIIRSIIISTVTIEDNENEEDALNKVNEIANLKLDDVKILIDESEVVSESD